WPIGRPWVRPGSSAGGSQFAIPSRIPLAAFPRGHGRRFFLGTRRSRSHAAIVPIGAPKSLTQCQRFFREPQSAKQRAYEALRAYFVEARPSQQVARAFGYSPGTFRVMCHQFRREPTPAFFLPPQLGPRTQPKKTAAHGLVIALRKRNYSVYDISEALKERHIALSPTAVREILTADGFAPLPRRLDDDRPVRPRATVAPGADPRAFSATPPPPPARSRGPRGSSSPAVGGCSSLCRGSPACRSTRSPRPPACPARE